MKILATIREFSSLIFNKPNGDDVELKPSSKTVADAEANIILNVPDDLDANRTVSNTDTFTLNESTQALTNKTIDADSNTISNIDNDEIKAAAAIALNKLAAVTADRALLSDASGFVSASTVTNVELGHLSGVTSSIQSQLNAKVDTPVVNADVDASAAIALSKLAAVTASRALVSDGSGFVSPSSVTATELGHLSGVTSSLQTQLDSKQPDVVTTEGDIVLGDGSGDAARLGIGASGFVLTSDGTTASWVAPSGGGNVSTTTIADNALVRGDGGGTSIQDSSILIDDSDNITGANSLTTVADIQAGGEFFSSFGVETSPSYSFTGRTNDGMFSNAAGSLGFAAGGTRIATLSSDGRVALDNTNGSAFLATDSTSASLPGFSFNNDTDTGMYRAGANTIGWATGGTERFTLSSTGTFAMDGTNGGVIRGVDGTSGSPSFAFTNDVDTGIFLNSDGVIGVTAAATRVATIASNGRIALDNTNGSAFLATDSTSAALPGFSFNNDTDTGVYRAADNTIGFATNGLERTRIDSAGNIIMSSANGGSLGLPDGTAANPTMTFTDDSDLGIFRNSADTLGFSANGVRVATLGSNGRLGLDNTNGSAFLATDGNTPSLPGFSFNNDTDTGMYRSAANTLAFATGGTSNVSIDSGGLLTSLQGIVVNSGGATLDQYEETTGSLGGGFTSGTYIFTRVGRVVTLTLIGPMDNFVGGVISIAWNGGVPSTYRPSTTALQCSHIDGSKAIMIEVSSGGNLVVRFRDSSFAATTSNGTTGTISITYNV